MYKSPTTIKIKQQNQINYGLGHRAKV